MRHAAEQFGRFGRFGCLAGLEGLAGLRSLEGLVVPAGREDLLLFSTTAKERQGVVSPGIHPNHPSRVFCSGANLTKVRMVGADAQTDRQSPFRACETAELVLAIVSLYSHLTTTVCSPVLTGYSALDFGVYRVQNTEYRI